MATQNSNDSNKTTQVSQPVTNSGSLNGIIRGVNEDYLTKNPNLPEPEEIEYEILAILRNQIMLHNSIALPGTKYKIPETLPNVSIKEVMLKKYRLVNVFFDGMKESDCGLLAIYMESGKQAGTYSADMDIICGEILRFNNSITKKGMDEVIHLIKLKAPKVSPCNEKNLVPVNNGIFDFDTKTLLPFTPDKIFLSKVRVDYNPFAKNMFIHNNEDGTDWDVESWILDIMDDKPDMAELIWQVIGAIIRPNVKWGRACFMYSESGNNGKGTLCSLMRNLVGEGSYTSIPLADFGKDFMLEPLIHSSAVIVDENDVGTYLDKVGNLKAVITGDVVQINRKFKQPISFRFNGFMVQCLNELPRVKDKSDSFYRRQLFIPFTKCFTGAERKYIKNDYANDDFTVLAINPVFLYHFIHADRVVGQNMKRDYFQYAIEDIMNFQSKYSLLLYLELRIRQKYDVSLNMPVNAVPTEVRFYTNALKDVFGLSFDSYTQTIDGVQHFNRASFERKVLCPALEEINKSRMIKILPPKEDECGIHEALFRKTKFNNKIKYYYIYFLTQEEIFIDTEGQYFNREKLQEILCVWSLTGENQKISCLSSEHDYLFQLVKNSNIFLCGEHFHERHIFIKDKKMRSKTEIGIVFTCLVVFHELHSFTSCHHTIIKSINTGGYIFFLVPDLRHDNGQIRKVGVLWV